MYRYPSPGSASIDNRDFKIDYKTAYRESHYQIRYDVELKVNTMDVSITAIDPLTETTAEK